MPQWTAQQQDAISDRGHSLIVCAAAGSGKTAVLVERIVQLVREGCPIERMLVVTFTNAAAGEMRLRISRALDEAARTQSELAEQAMAVSRASISTLHSFCGNMLREHFQALGIDPAFRIGDEQECGVLRAQAMEDALYACYDVGSEAFLAADACYEQEELTELAAQIHRFMMTRPDPWEFLARAQDGCAPALKQLAHSPAVALLLEDARDRLTQLAQDASALYALCMGEQGPAFYADACAQDMARVQEALDAAGKGYEALRLSLNGIEFARLGRAKKSDVYDPDIAARVKAGRDELKKAVKALGEDFALPLGDAAADIALTQKPLEGLCELVRTMDALYTGMKRRRGILDFNDLEHGALRALEHEEVRAALAAKYRYVFIDEYQDSSAIQEAIIGSFAPADGCFFVGDVKQSIYRFRQAEPALFLEKAARYDREDETLARRIDLQKNFRSLGNVLEGVNAVFETIMRADVTEIEYDERERLFCGLGERENEPPIELHIAYAAQNDGGEEDAAPDEDAPGEDGESDARELAAIEREALIAAARIRELVGTPYYDAKQQCERPLCYRDMAVLMRVASGSAALAADILTSEGIPVFCDAGEGYFDIPEIRAVMALLQTIDSGRQDEALIAALRGPACGLTDEELAAIRIAAPDSRTPYHEAVRRYRQEQGDALAAKLDAFDRKLAFWRLCARHQGVDRLLERIYAETGFLAQAGALPGGAARQANLHLLTSRAHAFMASQGGSLSAFLRYAARLKAGGDSMNASAIGESEDVVRIMTTHKSKGLEFPVVFVLGMARRMSTKTASARLLMHAQLGIGLPCIDTQLHSERDTLLRKAIRVKATGEQLAEEVRILYVAMTRAQARLIMIGAIGRDEPSPAWLRVGQKSALRAMRTGLDMVCPALAAAGACLTIREETVRAGKSTWHVFAHRDSSASKLRRRSEDRVRAMIARLEATPLEDGELAQLLSFTPEHGAMVRKTSVSAVVRDEKREREDGEDMPRREAEIRKLPRFMQEKQMTGAQIGTAFHRLMRMLDLDALRNSSDIAGEIRAQREAMLAKGILTRAEYDAVPARLPVDFFASPLGVRMLKSAQVHREWAFTYRRVTQDGAAQLVQGIIDCCFEERGRWVLVDYKTDSPSDVPGAIARHRPQLEIYADALNTITGMPVIERVLYLVRASAGYCV